MLPYNSLYIPYHSPTHIPNTDSTPSSELYKLREREREGMDPMVAERSSSAPSSRGGIMDTTRAVMMAVVIVVVSGWLFMWVMAPTRVYRQIWLPKIQADTISTFFGTQGYISLIEFVVFMNLLFKLKARALH